MGSASVLTGLPAEGGFASGADPKPQSQPTEAEPMAVTSDAMNDGSGYQQPYVAPVLRSGGSSGVGTVMGAVICTAVVMLVCMCGVAYCCCKELCGEAEKLGESGDYDLANLGEAALAGGAAEHFYG